MFKTKNPKKTTPPSTAPPATAPPATELGIFGVMRVFAPWIRPYRWQVLGAFLSIILVAAGLLSFGRAIALLVDEGLASTWRLNQSMAICIVIALMVAVGSYLRTVLINHAAERVIADLRKAMYRHMMGLSTAWFEEKQSGDVISTFATDTIMIQSILASTTSMAVRNVILLVGGLVMVVLTSPKLTLVVLALVPLVVVPLVLLGRSLKRQSRLAQDRLAALSVELDESLTAIDDIIAFGRTETMMTRFDKAVEASFSASRKRVFLRGLMSGFVIFLVIAAVGLIIWLGGRDLLRGAVSAGDLSAFVFYATLVAASVSALSDIGGEWQRLGGAAARIMDLLNQNARMSENPNPQKFPSASGASSGASGGGVEIHFDNVHFRYPARPSQVLEGLNLTIKAGETIAIVGESGAGKTTIFKLLLRLYDADKGRVSIGGVDVKAMALSDLRQNIAIVPQMASLFSASVYENIRFGVPDASADAVKSAAREAHADAFIRALPEGYHTLIGTKGVQLSGGQRQRLALARALLRGSPILLLDEATSALDSVAEQNIQTALLDVMKHRTTLVIAHRLSTVINADRIVLMQQGRVVASGDHESLIATSPLYHRLASLQFMAEDQPPSLEDKLE